MPVASEINARCVDNTFSSHSKRFIVYVDHIAVFGRDRARADCAMNRIISELDSCGLLTHEHTPAATQCDLLGMHIDGDRKEIHMTAKRYWRI